MSEQQEAVAHVVSEQQGACRDPVTLQGESELSGQPIAVSEYPKTTRSGRVVKRPQYLKDFHTEWEQARNRELKLTIRDTICGLLLEQFFFCLFINFFFTRKRMLCMVA